MKKYIIYISWFFSFIFILSCKKSHIEINEIKLKPDFKVEKVNDSVFFIDVRSIYYDRYLYVLESEYNRVFILDDHGKYLSSFGTKGRGPSELFSAIQITVNQDTVIIYSSGKSSFQRFSNGSFIDEIPIPLELGHFIGFRFTQIKENIFLTPFNGKGSVASLKIKNPEDNFVFGTIIKSDQKRRELFQNCQIVLAYGNQVITVPKYHTKIERYNLNGELLEIFDLKYLHLFKERLDYIESFSLAENQIIDMAVDAYVYKDKLYILPYLNIDEKIYTNRIIQFCLKSLPMKPEVVFNLGDGGFSTIAISDKFIWAFLRGDDFPGLQRYTIGEI